MLSYTKEILSTDNILKKLKTGENYIFASGNLGREIFSLLLENGIPVEAFADNYPKNQSFCNIPLITPDKIQNKNANIIIASINYMYDLEYQVRKNGFSNIISFGNLTKIFPELQKFNQAYDGLWDDYKINKDKYNEVYSMLDDDKSKNVFEKIIMYRQTSDSLIYSDIYNRDSIQYFENIFPFPEIFVDGGAFDGQNSLDYISRVPNYKKIFVFEPDKDSMKTTRTSLSKLNNIEFFEYGISDKERILRFDSRHSFGSLIAENGDSEIRCIALDDVIDCEKAYIKMDIEGAELDGIKGAKRLISNGSTLAICVYHKPRDIWELPLTIKEIYPNYKFKLRHYSSCIFETVLYAIP